MNIIKAIPINPVMIKVMPNPRNDGNRTGGDRPHDPFVVETVHIFDGSAPPRQNQHLCPSILNHPGDRARNGVGRLIPLDEGR